LATELGDALFVLFCLANSTDVDLQAAFDATLEKYRTRDEER
jgi:NTP pyrophosphatase (non-canonical NTP hydrolase)